MSKHVIVGAGPVGTTTALLLAGEGHDVRVVTRSGSGPQHDRIQRIAADASDAATLTGLCQDAAAVYNCANPPYHRWPKEWPPLAHALLAAAESSGAVLVTLSNLYGYGPVDGVMTEDLPLSAPGTKGRIRAGMWEDALSAHRAGRVQVTEVRASDFFGPLVTTGGHLGERAVPRLLAGKPIRVIGDPDAAHSWTYVPDVARALAVVATDERAWGRAWHVPTNAPLSQRQMIAQLAGAASVAPPKVAGMPRAAVVAAGLVSPMIRELREVLYQFERPFVIDSSAFTHTFGVQPTPLDDALATTITWWRQRGAVAQSVAGAGKN